MKIFVTGAAGFVGGAFTTAAVKAGHDVRAMSRSEKSDGVIREFGAEPWRSNLGALEIDHLLGCHAVVHSAAFVEQWGTREQFWNANVVGTEQLLKTARAAGVKRFVHVGTEAALFHGQEMPNIDETYPYPEHTPFLYSETKAEAEKRVLGANETGVFETISIRPRLVWGPGDKTVLAAVKEMVAKGGFMWMDGGQARTSITHIDNLVEALMLALEIGRAGEAYFVTDDENMTFREFLTSYLKTQGVRLPDKSIPGWLARAAAAGLEGVWKALPLRSAPPLTRFAASITSRECTINIDKIKRDMGYRPVITVAAGMKSMPVV